MIIQTIVSASIISLHRNEDVFPSPNMFTPESWLEEMPGTTTTRNAHLIPFGYGARVCLGKPLAIMEIKMLIAGIYLTYESTLPTSTTPETMKQYSTHDAVPKSLSCDVVFRKLV